MTTNIAIQTEGVTKRYSNGVLALDNLWMKVEKGDVVGYLGPNGAGKTTTMEILTSIIKSTSGRAYINGIDVVKRPKEALRHVGALIEVPGIYEYLTPVESLTYSGKIYGMNDGNIKKRIKEVMEKVSLSDWCNKKVGSFSTGMLRRFNLARAMLHDPEILILDEPVIGLDPKGMQDVRNIIKELQKEGKTILLSSHLLGEVSETCNKIIFIAAGKVVKQGPIDDIKKEAVVNRIVVNFLDAISSERASIIKKVPHVTGFEFNGAQGTIEFDGGYSECSKILKKLVADDINIVSFTPQVGSLEDMYVSLVGGSVR